VKFAMRMILRSQVLLIAGLAVYPFLPVRHLHAQKATPGELVVHPAEITAPLPNPYMGLGLWAGPRGLGNNEKDYTVAECTSGFGDDAPLFNWVLVDWAWSSLEPTEGQFAWQDFDAVVRYWSERGKQVVVRFWVTDDTGWNGSPGAEVLPGWLWKKGVKSHSYIGNGGHKILELDYADASYTSVYLPALQRFLDSFAVRYDHAGTPIILLQTMGYGHWADFATWYSKYPFPSVQVKHDVLTRLLQVYIHRFSSIQLLQMAGSDWDGDSYPTLDSYLYSKALDVAAANNFGFIWTGFIDGNRGRYTRTTMERYWRDHPVIAEGSWSYDGVKDQLTHGTMAENVDGAIDWHANFLHLYFAPDAYRRAMREDKKALEGALQSGGIGYRLVPTSLSWPVQLAAGRLLVLHQRWTNRNAGRLYVAHPLKLYLTGAKGNSVFDEAIPGFSETDWVAGKDYSVMSVFHLPKTIAAGEYEVRIALVDASGKPAIRLGIAGEDSMHRYQVGKIRITAKDTLKVCDNPYCP
jgi:hypothetical protein